MQRLGQVGGCTTRANRLIGAKRTASSATIGLGTEDSIFPRRRAENLNESEAK